jgi:membrane-associated phospholipid phosphatase
VNSVPAPTARLAPVARRSARGSLPLAVQLGWWQVPLGLLLADLVVTVDVLTGGPLRHLDHRVHDWGASARWPQLEQTASWVALAGQRGLVTVVVMSVTALVSVRLRSWRPLLVSVAATGALNVVVGALKLATGRTAPYTGRDELFVRGTEFPSGHSSNSVLMWGALVLVLTCCGVLRGRRQLIVAIGLVATVCVLVGAASVYLDTHWVTDVLTGWLVGGALLAALTSVARHALSSAQQPLPRGTGSTQRVSGQRAAAASIVDPAAAEADCPASR